MKQFENLAGQTHEKTLEKALLDDKDYQHSGEGLPINMKIAAIGEANSEVIEAQF